VKVALVIVAWFSIAPVFVAGCGGSTQGGEIMPPVVSVVPDDFVLRDVRKDAAQYLNCQVPDVQVTIGPWAGSSGNVTAYGCGYQISYYLRCIANHQCSITVVE